MHNISYHLQNKNNLDMFTGPEDAPLKLDQDIHDSLRTLIDDAKRLGIEGLQKRKYE